MVPQTKDLRHAGIRSEVAWLANPIVEKRLVQLAGDRPQARPDPPERPWLFDVLQQRYEPRVGLASEPGLASRGVGQQLLPNPAANGVSLRVLNQLLDIGLLRGVPRRETGVVLELLGHRRIVRLGPQIRTDALLGPVTTQVVATEAAVRRINWYPRLSFGAGGSANRSLAANSPIS